MQENGAGAARRARSAARERARGDRRVREGARPCVRPALVSGDTAVIHWVFEFSTRDGRAIRLDELALQRWDGDRIAEERFYYDPIQMNP